MPDAITLKRALVAERLLRVVGPLAGAAELEAVVHQLGYDLTRLSDLDVWNAATDDAPWPHGDTTDLDCHPTPGDRPGSGQVELVADTAIGDARLDQCYEVYDRTGRFRGWVATQWAYQDARGTYACLGWTPVLPGEDPCLDNQQHHQTRREALTELLGDEAA